MLTQGYSNELSKTEMLEQNAPSVNFDSKKNCSEEINSKMNSISKNAKIGMSQFHAFSKIIDDIGECHEDAFPSLIQRHQDNTVNTHLAMMILYLQHGGKCQQVAMWLPPAAQSLHRPTSRESR